MERKRRRIKKDQTAGAFQPTDSMNTQQSGGTYAVRTHLAEKPRATYFELTADSLQDILLLTIEDTEFLDLSRDLLIHYKDWPGDYGALFFECTLAYYDEHEKAPKGEFRQWYEHSKKIGKFPKQIHKITDKWVENLLKRPVPDRTTTLRNLQGIVDQFRLQARITEAAQLTRKGQTDLARETLVSGLEETDPRHLEEATKEKMEELPFPLDIIDGSAGEFVESYSNVLESPKHFWYMCYLTCLGTMLADKVQVKTQLRAQPRLYTVLLGESASTRKSTAIYETTAFFEAYDNFHTLEGSGSGEGVARVIRDRNPLLLSYDEFKIMVDKAKIQNATLLTVLNILFEKNELENPVKKVKDSIGIRDGYLSLLAASTIDTFRTLFTTAFLNIGFINRLFLVPGESNRKDSLPDPIGTELIDRLRANLNRTLARVGTYAVMPLLPKAKEMFDAWYMGELDNAEMIKSPHCKRLDTYAHRFMPLLAVNEGRPAIDLPIVEKVLKLVNWEFRVRQIYDPIDADNKAARMEENIRRVLKASPDGVTEGDMKKAVNSPYYGMFIYNHAKESLKKAKEMREGIRGSSLMIYPAGQLSGK